MADSLWYPSVTPTGSDAVDTVASGVNLGTQLYFTAAGTVSAVAYFLNNTTQSGAGTVGIWDNSGTLLASKTFSGHTGVGWKVVTFDTPVSVSANTRYTVGWWQQAGTGGSLRYRAASGYFTGNTVTSPGGGIVAPATGATVNSTVYTNGLYLYSAFARPTDTFEGGGYWVDAVFTASGASGSPGTASGTGTASGVGASTAAATGSAPGTSSAVASGAARFAASGSASGTGMASGTGRAVVAAVASASGISNVTGAGDALAGGSWAGTAAGTSSATATGASIASAVAQASGSSTAAAIAPGGQTQPNGDAGAGRQFGTKRRKVEDDPRNAMQRLVARFQEARAPVEPPEPVEPEKPAKRAPVAKEEPVQAEPAEDLETKAAEEAERLQREMEEDEEAAIMLLLAA